MNLEFGVRKMAKCALRSKLKLFALYTLHFALSTLIILPGCSDDRKTPTTPGIPTYSATITLLDGVSIAGDTLSRTFTLRDSVVDARLYITGFLKPDAALNQFNGLSSEVDSLDNLLLGLSAQIIGLDTISARTPEQQARLDSLRGVLAAEEVVKAGREAWLDSLDTRLDDRFKAAVRLDNDLEFYYPRATFFDSNTMPPDTTLVHRYLNPGETAVWGQGFWTPEPDTSGWIGKTMRLALSRFWIADDTYRAPAKPSRPANPDALPELYPITDWLGRLTPNTPHTLHIIFAAPGATAKVTASLYVVYKTTG